jgi:hypothetical protein
MFVEFIAFNQKTARPRRSVLVQIDNDTLQIRSGDTPVCDKRTRASYRCKLSNTFITRFTEIGVGVLSSWA